MYISVDDNLKTDYPAVGFLILYSHMVHHPSTVDDWIQLFYTVTLSMQILLASL